MKNKIILRNISVSFDGLGVLENFSAEISENTAIMGPSGKGKTTLVRAIMGLLVPDGGEIDFANKPKFSAVFQEDRLFEDFSAVKNVASVCGKNIDKKEEQTETVDNTAEQPADHFIPLTLYATENRG